MGPVICILALKSGCQVETPNGYEYFQFLEELSKRVTIIDYWLVIKAIFAFILIAFQNYPSINFEHLQMRKQLLDIGVSDMYSFARNAQGGWD